MALSDVTEPSQRPRAGADRVSSRAPGGVAQGSGSPGASGSVLPAAARDLVRSPYPPAVARGFEIAAHLQVRSWDTALSRLQKTQEAALADILRHARSTAFGRKHDFSRVRHHADYVRHVPVGDYDTFSPYIDRMRAGERNLLVPESVVYFGNSSGSSNHGKSKFLPITDRQIRHQQRAGADAALRYMNWSADYGLFSGFTLGLFPPTTMRREGPVFVTSNPALMMTKMPLFTRPVYLPEESVRVIPNYDEKLGVIAERYLDHDVRAVTGTTCWFTLLFEKVLAAARARGRSARTVSDVWPNLRVLFGGGVAAGPYLPVIRELTGRADITLVDTYNATEGGVYASSDFLGLPGMLMLPHRGTFFEFVRLEDRGTPGATRYPLWAVEKDRPYSIVVTTVSGLYAYELGDIVRFASADPPRIEFMGRLSGCLSVTQELTTHVEIERAVAYALSTCPSSVVTVDFGAAADVAVDGTAKSRYVLFVEFQAGAAPVDLKAFTAAFDEGLCKQNRVYGEHRKNEVALLQALVVPLASGGARRFMELVTNGNVHGKFPRIIDDTKKKLLWEQAGTR
jgi:hypothetical protein